MNNERLAKPTSKTSWNTLIDTPKLSESVYPHLEMSKNILPYLSFKSLTDAEKEAILEATDNLISLDGPDNVFVFQDYTENAVVNSVGELKSWQDKRIITPKIAEGFKLFSASLLDKMNRSESIDDIWHLYHRFFSASPNPLSYAGGLSGSLELLTIAERSDNNPCSSAIYGEVIYNSSFSSNNEYTKILDDSTPIKQLRLIPIMSKVAMNADPDGWSGPAIGKISEAFNITESKSETTPLVKLVIESYSRKIDDYLNAEWIDLDPENPEHMALIDKHNKRRAQFENEQMQEQTRLHKAFPSMPKDANLKQIAPDIVGAINKHWQIDTIGSKSGKKASLLDYQAKNTLGIDQTAAFLLGSAHNPEIKPLINDKLNLELSDISLPAQVQLLKFMAEAGNERFDKLCSVLHNINDESLRIKLLENFVAADFGEDFGDALLDIASSETLDNQQTGEILDTVTSARESIGKITGLYDGFHGGDFTKEYARASNERLTDALTVFRKIAKDGEVSADLGWAGESRFDYKSAMEALKYEAKSLEIISGTLGDVTSGTDGAFAEMILTPNFYKCRTMYNFYSPQYGYVLLYTRTEGSGTFDSSIEYGKKNFGVEASISLITNPVDPFILPSPYRPDSKMIKNPRYYDSITMDKVSAIRLDREGRTPGAPADDPNRDPINPIGTISVDLAAINDRADTPSGKIARLLSVGNKLREDIAGFSLNHNTRWFNQGEYGTDVGFHELVDYFDSMAKDWCNKRPAKYNQGFRAAMNRKRGKKIMPPAA